MTRYEEVKSHLENNVYTWLVTGVAGFIGSNLLETLLKLNQRVVGLDNFSTGYQSNLDEVKSLIEDSQWDNFSFYNGDIRDEATCALVCRGVDFVLHQAALGSVPRSINDPSTSNSVNVTGFLNILVASRDCNVKAFTYAASSSTYGDHPGLPKVEDLIGNPLSPYAVTKLVNELYADVFSRVYGFKSNGLRYFNVFGKRQDPKGAYAAVIPKWISLMISGDELFINGDGSTSRDFCFVENVIQANLLSSLQQAKKHSESNIYNVAVSDRTTLIELFNKIQQSLAENGLLYSGKPTFRDFRPGDVQHSLASIVKISNDLGYLPEFNLSSGLRKAMPWYLNRLAGV